MPRSGREDDVAPRGNRNHTGTLAAFAAGAVLLGAFLLIERRSRAPMLPPRVARDRSRGGANTVMFLLGTGMLAMFYLLTLYMQVVRGYSALHAGLAYLPYVAGVGLASGGLGPRLLGALAARAVIAAGMILGAAGLSWYAALLTPTSSYYAVMLPAMLAGGIGTGLTFVGCTVTGMRGVAPRDSGVAAGLLNTSLQTGSALGLGALAAIASTVTRTRLPGHTIATALTDGYVAGLLAVNTRRILTPPGETMNTSRGSTRTLVIGRSPEVNRSVVGPLLDAGIDAQGSTQPEQASRCFDARQFDLIAFGRGVPGPLRDRLKREFTARNPGIRFADVFAPIAVRQILAALAHDPADAEVH